MARGRPANQIEEVLEEVVPVETVVEELRANLEEFQRKVAEDNKLFQEQIQNQATQAQLPRARSWGHFKDTR
uniref:Uncharacterized protein n=1 Tax=Oryza glumipatula TaxID=40148 RepID=A0A0D9Z7V6_9ORYZ